MADYWCCIQADIMEQEIEQLKRQLAAAEQRAKQSRKVEDIADKLLKKICSYCPPWYREDISKCAKWCEMREKYELRQALAQAERGQDDV